MSQLLKMINSFMEELSTADIAKFGANLELHHVIITARYYIHYHDFYHTVNPCQLTQMLIYQIKFLQFTRFRVVSTAAPPCSA